MKIKNIHIGQIKEKTIPFLSKFTFFNSHLDIQVSNFNKI